MTKDELEKLLFTMTKLEQICRDHPDEAKLQMRNSDADMHEENGVLVLTEAGLVKAPIDIPGYEKASEHYPFLHISVNKHTRFSVVPDHRHEFVEINYIFNGHMEIVINGKPLSLIKGDLCIMDSDVTHSIAVTGEEDIILNILMPKYYFDMTFISTLVDVDLVTWFIGEIVSQKTKHDKYWLMHCGDNTEVRSLVEKIFCEFLDQKAGGVNVIRYSIGLLLIEAVRCYDEKPEITQDNGDSALFTDILRYIDENCVTCSLDEISRKFQYSPAHLSKKLKSKLGKSYKELVCELRLKRAVMLLKNTSEPITQIAEECGYQNQSFFYQKFYQYYEMTPKEYRQNNSIFSL